MIGKNAGKHQSLPILHLSKNTDTITDKKAIRDLLAETSSSQNSKQEFTTVKL